MNPTKVILKTAAKTLGALVILVIIFAFLLGLIFPAKLSSITYSMGMSSLSLKLDESAYSKTNNFDDLAKIIDKSIELDNNGNVVKYIKLAIERSDFDSFCDSEVSKTNRDYRRYIVGNYITSLIKVGDSDTATDICCQYTSCDNTKYIDYIKYIYLVVDIYNPSTMSANSMKNLIDSIYTNVSSIGGESYSNYVAEKNAIFDKLGF